MKKVFILLLFVSALVACSRLEVTPMEQDSKAAITYQTAPITKAYAEFAHSYVFESTAYYLHPTNPRQSWLNIGEESVLYVSPDVVSYTNGVWQMDKPHYWPKDGGTLTFFSWSLNKSTLNFNEGSNATVEIKPETGVCLNDFDITVDKGTDFVVADIAVDQTKNLNEYFTSGVPTLFRHKLASVSFTAETDKDYSESERFFIKSITVTNLAKTGNYQQGEVDYDANPCWYTVDRWTTEGIYDAVYYNGEMEVTETIQNVKGNQYYYIPETFDGTETIEIHYQILDVSSNVLEDVVLILPLKDVIGDSFKIGTIYTINLNFHLDEITWDPAVEDWNVSLNNINV